MSGNGRRASSGPASRVVRVLVRPNAAKRSPTMCARRSGGTASAIIERKERLLTLEAIAEKTQTSAVTWARPLTTKNGIRLRARKKAR